VKLQLATLFDSMWGNLEICHQFVDGTRQMMKLAYHEALTDNACSNLLELQKEAGLLSWNKAGENKFTFACHLANKLEIEVLWEPFNEYTISSTPNITLATLSIKEGLHPSLGASKYLSSAFRSRQLGSLRPPQVKEGYTAFKSMGNHAALDSRP